MRKRLATLVIGCFATLGLFALEGPSIASAGGSGQQLSLYDVAGNYYSAIVGGDNQSCQLVYYYINDWPVHHYDIPGWWWQSWSGCNPYYIVEVWAYPGTNQTGKYAEYGLNGPPHSQSNNWWTCEIDGGSACGPGQDIYGKN